MAQTLLLRLPAPGEEQTEWLAIEEPGAGPPTRQRGPLSLAAAVAGAGKVIVLAPSTQILLAEPELPPGSGVKLARAVPFALEEQLTEDVDKLTFAIGRRRANGTTPVAVVSRAVLEGWLAALSAASIEPAAMYPDILMMPENPSQTVLWLEHGTLAVRRAGALPFAVELSPVSEALVVAGVIPDPYDTETASRPPESIVLYVTREDWARVQGEFEALAGQFETFNVQLLADGALPWLARAATTPDAVNLLQGEFARTTDFGTRWQRWRTPALVGAGLLAVHLCAQAIQLRHAKREEARLDTEIAAVFSSAMPGQVVEHPRRQMQARLERIQKSGSSPEYFLRSLKVLGDALGAVPNTQVDALSYRDNALELKMAAPSMGALAQLTQLIGKQGLSAQIQSSAPAASGIEAHVQVRDAGAHR